MYSMDKGAVFSTQGLWFESQNAIIFSGDFLFDTSKDRRKKQGGVGQSYQHE